jgi:hypothetical protein
MMCYQNRTSPSAIDTLQNKVAVAAFLDSAVFGSSTFTLTVGQDILTGYGGDVFNAPLTPAGGETVDQPTLTSGDSLTEISPATGAVLNAYFDGTASATGVNIEVCAALQ